MKRRLVVAGLAVALGGASLGAGAKAAEDCGPQTLGEAEQGHLHRLRSIAALSLALSKLAAERADNDDLREFVQFEIAEQDGLLDVLGLAADAGRSALPAPRLGDAAGTEALDDASRTALGHLERQSVGTAFDHDYVHQQIELHKQTLEAHDDYLSEGRHTFLVAITKLARAAAKEHTTLLGDLDAALAR